MKKTRKASTAAKKKEPKKSTRQRLLEIACNNFAQYGFQNTHTYDICLAANANIAAVNYHFGGKEGLYKAVWDYVVEHTVSMNDLPEISKDEDREWIYNYLRICVLSVFDKGTGGLLQQLIANEINDPSPFSTEMLSEHLSPQIHELEKRLRRMMGPHVTDFQIGCCILAIHSQFSALTINRRAKRNLFISETPSEVEADHFTREICAFIMGGIRAIKSIPASSRRDRTKSEKPNQQGQ